jgi:hypothetical protein
LTLPPWANRIQLFERRCRVSLFSPKGSQYRSV